MRSDMHEIIIERPRHGHWRSYPRAFARNRYARTASRLASDDVPSRERMGAGYARKDLNENLAPLVRFLRSRVGKPWRKVRSEIAEHLQVTSAVQKHVMDHVKQVVMTETWIGGDGRVWGAGRWGRPEPVAPTTRPDFYVDPKTGHLAIAPLVARKKKKEPARADVRRLSPTTQLRRIDGVWFAVALAPMPPAPPGTWATARVWDVVAGCWARRFDGSLRDPAPMRREWWEGHYAMAKRQLGKKEIARLL